MPKQPETIGQAQLEVLQYIADHQPIRVGDVAEHFAETQGKARTTILTVMEKLREKGFLTRRKRRGVFHYALRSSKREVLSSVVERFVEQSLGGSISPFIAYLAESRGLTEDELGKLNALLQDLDPSNRKEGE